MHQLLWSRGVKINIDLLVRCEIRKNKMMISQTVVLSMCTAVCPLSRPPYREKNTKQMRRVKGRWLRCTTYIRLLNRDKAAQLGSYLFTIQWLVKVCLGRNSIRCAETFAFKSFLVPVKIGAGKIGKTIHRHYQ